MRKARPPHVRDTKESRLLLVLLIVIAFALITVDIRGGEDSPIDGARKAAATVLGPVESGVAGAVDPIAALERENAALKTRLGSDARNQSRVRQLDAMLKKAGAGQYGIRGAEVVAIGP